MTDKLRKEAMMLTVKFLNFRTPENFALIYLKFKQIGQTLGYFVKNANGIANSEDPDQTAPLGAVCSGSALFAQTNLSKKLGSLQYLVLLLKSFEYGKHVKSVC